MTRNILWKFLFIVFVVLLSIYEIYPPRGSDVAFEFQRQARKRDGDFTNIVHRVQELQRANPDRSFANLIDAIGTNDIARYFPAFETKAEMNPNRYILNRLQREAAGRIRLGLDLQGGTSFLVGMQFAANPESLVETFNQEGKNKDAAFTNLVSRLAEVLKENPAQPLEKLREAVGTNDFAKHFEDVPKSGSPDRATEVLAWLQQKTGETAGRERALSQAVEVLRKRVDKFGVAEPIIQPAGSDRILIQLPGLSEADKESALRQIQRAAFLEFRMVHEKSREMIDQGVTEPGYEILKEERTLPSGAKELIPYLVKKKPERGLTGKYVKNAFVTRHQVNNQPQIAFNLDTKGAEIFAQITEENVGKQLAIVLDGALYSAPVINEPIRGGSGVISGSFDVKEAIELANVLENPLEAPVKIIESREVDPSLGKDTIRSAIKASVIGVIAVAGFMLVYYLMAGIVANIALMLNIVILLGIMCYFHTTFTLPGIAGVVLTIGMAVDANVLIYERIREELAAGKSMRGALVAGYSKAFGTIFDSNLTTLISSVILIFMGTGPVKGFGVALTIGISVSMFTALVVTRLIFDWLLARNLLKSLAMLHLIRAAKIDFMRWAVLAFVLSWSLILIGNGYGIYRQMGGGKTIFGPDFAGGDQQTYTFEKITETARKQALQDNLRKTITALNVGDPSIQFQKDISTGTENLRVTTAFDTADKVQKALGEQFPEAKFKLVGLDKVGPTVGKEIQRTALIASLLAMFGILVYVAFRYEFSFAVGAVLGLVHDILMTLGWFFLSGRELSAPIVAAVLTIIGFSINDTIVIFDRIREDLKLGVRGTFKEVMNQALNQTLSRTIITSGTVFLATFSLYLFGGGVVNDFAFTFLVGIVTGTYSSIYISSAFVLWWHKGQRPTLGSQVTMQPAAAPAQA